MQTSRVQVPDGIGIFVLALLLTLIPFSAVLAHADHIYTDDNGCTNHLVIHNHSEDLTYDTDPLDEHPWARSVADGAATAWNDKLDYFAFRQEGIFDSANDLDFNPVAGSDIAITQISSYCSSGHIWDIDIIFDENEQWEDGDTAGSDSKYDFRTLAMHEFGHTTTLRDLYDAVASIDHIMYGYWGFDDTETIAVHEADKVDSFYSSH